MLNRKMIGQSARQAGHQSKENDDVGFPTREAAQDWVDRLVATTGASPALLNVYSCRYAPPGNPHYHVGHKPGLVRNWGRMEARQPGRKRRCSR